MITVNLVACQDLVVDRRCAIPLEGWNGGVASADSPAVLPELRDAIAGQNADSAHLNSFKRR